MGKKIMFQVVWQPWGVSVPPWDVGQGVGGSFYWNSDKKAKGHVGVEDW
jgi:hypothetical protein